MVAQFSNPANAGCKISSEFETYLSGALCWTSEKVSVWVSGHTHFGCDFVAEGKRIVSNPIGYYFTQAEGFDTDKVVEF
jgi:hypothetical protein